MTAVLAYVNVRPEYVTLNNARPIDTFLNGSLYTSWSSVYTTALLWYVVAMLHVIAGSEMKE